MKDVYKNLILLLPLSFLFFCTSYTKFMPKDNDSSRISIHKARIINYDLGAPISVIIEAYRKIIDNKEFYRASDSMEDIVWSYYDIGFLLYRDSDFNEAKVYFNKTIEVGKNAKKTLSYITNQNERAQRTDDIQSAINLATLLVKKIEDDRTEQNAHY